MKPCILPWINFGTNTFGRARVCGYSEFKSDKLKDSSIEQQWNSDYFKQIRLDFLNGKWPENCRRCEYVENLGGKSKKDGENYYFYEPYKHLIDQTNQDGSVDYYPPHIDLRVGTICNLKCIHCGTGASSKWQEDKQLLNKYPNTEKYDVDNKWIEQDSYIWDNIRANIAGTKKLNFLGGEPFANKQHNNFLKDLSNSPHCKDIHLFYVTNGTLLDQTKLDQLVKFKQVTMQISLDVSDLPCEFFRFPIKWNQWIEKLQLVNQYVTNYPNLFVSFQWTCSNVSMVYLSDTYKFAKNNFPNFRFDFCNHVEWPIHMSAQVLPDDVKQLITHQLNQINWKRTERDKINFYINHMNEKPLWNQHGKTFINYLNDLSEARGIDWKHNLSYLHELIESANETN